VLTISVAVFRCSIYFLLLAFCFQSTCSIRISSIDGISGIRSEWTLESPFISRADGVYQYVRQLYAADYIAKLEENNDNNQHTNEIVELSVSYHIMNSKTSFVVVDEKGNSSVSSLPIPVGVPHYSGSHNMVGMARGGAAPRHRLHSSSGTSAPVGRVLCGSPSSPPGGAGKTALPGGESSPGYGSFFGDEEEDEEGGSDDTGNAALAFDQPTRIFRDQDASLDGMPMHVDSLKLLMSSAINDEVAEQNEMLDSLGNDLNATNEPVRFKKAGKKEAAPPKPASSSWGFFATRPAIPETKSVASGPAKKGEDLDALLNYKSADGSFSPNEDSLALSCLSSGMIASFARTHNFSEQLTFNLFVLKIYKNDGSKKYVMIIRNLEKWIDKQLKATSVSDSI
jgi:hypothetical protein